MAKAVLKGLHALVSAVVCLVLLVAGLYSVYALWDNSRIYAAAEDVQTNMLAFKPQGKLAADNAPSFAQLRSVNPDVCAWLTVDHTNIDYPVLQGENNLSYINTDVYGNFSLAGSIFLDSRCTNTFCDSYALLYGHHMARSKMFGDLDRFKEARFFAENSGGTLLLPDRSYSLTIFACLLVPSSESAVFEPQQWRDNSSGLVDYARRHAVHLRQSVLDRLRASDEAPQILGMSTCASEFTDARTVILSVMEPV